MKLPKLSAIIISTLFLIPSFVAAQTIETTWLNDKRKKVPKEEATMRVEVEKRENGYYRSAYLISKNRLISRGVFADTSWQKPVGAHLLYDSSGYLKDSAFYDTKSQKIFAIHYYPSGKEYIRYSYDAGSRKENIVALDESGNPIPGFIYEREAEFPGGSEGWRKHLVKNLNPKVPIRRNANDGLYKVIIRFIVNKDGTLSDIEPETNLGFGMEEEAMRVIRLSPNWVPAVQYNRPVKAYRRQPIAFMVSK